MNITNTDTVLAEYLWVDGVTPTAGVRSKTRTFTTDDIPAPSPGKRAEVSPADFPEWGADGSSTQQAEGSDSDIVLRPVCVTIDPFRPQAYLVLCEVFTGEGEPHPSNARQRLRKVLDAGGADLEALFGFEQEYTLFQGHRPLGFPDQGYPAPQGPYYCGIGPENIAGREFYDESLQRCLAAGLRISGANWEVMPGQAEIQVGAAGALEGPDHVWLARWIMARVGETYGVTMNLDPKPVPGDWNGAGMHTNFSTKEMRGEGGMAAIEKACNAIGELRKEHLTEYGHGYQHRLTGAHETCSYKEFRWGVADRTASIRVPRHVAAAGKGYLEDRRPNANADPYRIAARLIQTVLDA